MGHSSQTEHTKFLDRIRQPHLRINPCFMTGKGCVYTETIDRAIDSRRMLCEDSCSGFLIVPFQPNISAFLEMSFKRFMQETYGGQEKTDFAMKGESSLELTRADQVRRTGYVICQKICKRIQEADFVVADITVANENVFYELGLSYGSNQKILAIRQGRKDTYGEVASSYLLGGGCRVCVYADLLPIDPQEFLLSQKLWQRGPMRAESPPDPTIAFLNDFDESSSASTTSDRKDITLDFVTHVKASVGVAIDDIVRKISANSLIDSRNELLRNYAERIEKMKAVKQIDPNDRFQSVQQIIDPAFCSIIRTGPGVSPKAYFWLGYCHALGKNVIPVSVAPTENAPIDDLAFDIRALWHMRFVEKDPSRFASEIHETLDQMIVSDFAEWSRKHFWDGVLGRRGKVSVFTGALHNKEIGREMIGDWDLRATSELASFFASHQYRASIESPVYQIEQVVTDQKTALRDEYIEGLVEMLRDKNCIVIASPDVNPLTEIVLGELYGIPRSSWFTNSADLSVQPNATCAVKHRTNTEDTKENSDFHYFTERAFYRTELSDGSGRGFYGSWLPQNKIMGEFVGQTAPPRDYRVHAHLLIAMNPFRDKNSRERKFVIVLNGVSGPATFALTHALTGGISQEFVAYGPFPNDSPLASNWQAGEPFNSESECEKLLQEILIDFGRMVASAKPSFLQFILEIGVGPGAPPAPGMGQVVKLFDWRRIKRWRRV